MSKLHESVLSFPKKKITAIIPSFKPSMVTYRLVMTLLKQDPSLSVIFVDDSTPVSAKRSTLIIKKLEMVAKKNSNLVVLHTPQNLFKASALNFGIEYIMSQRTKPDVVLTLDDDVSITKTTIPYLVNKLFSKENIGVVCTTAWVKNKNANLLTRLQSLEYHGFTVTKIGDNGFLKGPLVMQGMLSAFRYVALASVKGFLAHMLLEDYDITVRIKKAGWISAIEPKAVAYTVVPDSLKVLMKQRIRWSYGGLVVVGAYWRSISAIFQDVLGHLLFLGLLGFIILSFVFTRMGTSDSLLVLLVIIAAIVNFLTAFLFNTLTLLRYPDRDRKDWAIKLSIIPEFVYSNLLSLILFGSYLFFTYTVLSRIIVKRLPVLQRANETGLKAFQRIGYTNVWGTKV